MDFANHRVQIFLRTALGMPDDHLLRTWSTY